MQEGDKLFAGSIPALYDRFLVPLIFEAAAEDMAARVAEGDPAAVLEIAAGTGVVTRALAPRLGPECRYVVPDLNQPMLDHARSRQPEVPRLVWQAADALALPFEEASFDVVCCQFGVMFFPDRVAGFREARRVLRPGGRFILSTWDRLELSELPHCVTRAVDELYPDDPPRFLERTPHGYHDPERIRSDLAAAGFGSVAVDFLDAISAAPRAWDVATAFCQGTPMRNELEARGASLEAVTAHAARAVEREYGAGPVSGRIRALVVTAMP
ncbi:class I SAM-dependent methyltransferase [Amaricoccus solimangrovi]|uniref:Class I SAM-dependent methyltransferase n=1 Tax=Amaricoccus solimangrovi TaxID=2589815 RepID=A0A501WQQ7_9RHOB|nr:class I SAM-dependent methyltransferase [Amaricoccus solimangrovi]TPE50404.1 class I SAM-dependent methyltransferase [Amaricoccus solimangrovi]